MVNLVARHFKFARRVSLLKKLEYRLSCARHASGYWEASFVKNHYATLAIGNARAFPFGKRKRATT